MYVVATSFAASNELHSRQQVWKADDPVLSEFSKVMMMTNRGQHDPKGIMNLKCCDVLLTKD